MSDLLDRCGEQLTKAWDLPEIPTGRISSSHPSSSSELAEIFGRSDDEDEEFEAFGDNQETQLTSAGLIQRTSVTNMAEILTDSKVSLNSAQQSIKEENAKEPRRRRRSARLHSISRSEVNQVTANKLLKVDDSTSDHNQCPSQRPKNERTESGSEGIYSEGSDVEHKKLSEEENSSEEDSEGDDPDKLWCICKKPHGDRFMICCDQCEEWYHGDCVGISVAQGKRMERYGEDYVCVRCKEKEQYEKEEKSKLRAERLEKREANKSKEFEVLMIKGSSHGGSNLFTPDNLPKGKSLMDIKLKRPSTTDSDSKRKASKSGIKCLHCTTIVHPPIVMCGNECIRKHVKHGIEVLAGRGVNVTELEGVAVVDKSSGRVFVGGAAPRRRELIDWLQSHRSYQIHLPTTRRQSSTNKEPAGDTSSSAKVAKVTSDSTSVRENAKKLLAQALWHRCETADDDIKNVTTKEQVEKLANQIEENLFSLHNEITIKYKNKYRSLLFNLRDSKNQGLFQKVVRGQLETKELVTLSSEQLASEELRHWRQQEIKKHLEKIKEREEEINRDTGTKRKITYKGEIEIEATEKEQALSSERPQSSAIIVSPSSLTSPGLPVNTTSQHSSHTFDANCDICQGKLVTTSTAPVKPSVTKEKASMDLQRSHDISSKPLFPSKWKGLISMPTFTKFVASARGLSGAADYMLELLPDILNVEGRIRFAQVWEYLAKLQVSSSRDISVICFESVSEVDDQANYIALLDYLVGRDRCGVVALGDREIKDFYLVPLIAGSPIPQHLPTDCKKVLSIEESRDDVLLGIIVHSKVLGRSRHHHHRHKRTHPHHYSTEKKSRIEVGVGNVTPPGMGESPKRSSIAPPFVTSSTASPIVTSSMATPTVTSSKATTFTVTSSMAAMSTVASVPSMYGTGENEVTSTSITHFSAGIKEDDAASSDTAYSPSDKVEKGITASPSNRNPLSVRTEEFLTPSLSPNTMSRLQSLIQTVKDSIASLPSSAAAKQEDSPQSVVQPSTVDDKNSTVSSSNETTQSAYVFHESLPVTTSVAMVTSLPVMQQHPGFYGNQEIYKPRQTPPPMYGDNRFDHHHSYQGQREQWIPYRSKWSPQRR